MLVIGFSTVTDSGWSDKATITLLVLGFVAAILAVVNFFFTPRTPLVPPRLLSTKTTVFFLVANFLQSFLFFGASYYLPVYVLTSTFC
jgi:hypothetical protein